MINPEKLGKLIAEELANEDGKALFIGSFKPPHAGHYAVAQEVASLPYVTEVIILIGRKERDGIDANMSKKIWDLYLKCQPNPKIKVTVSANASPIKDVYNYLSDNITEKVYVTVTPNDTGDEGYINGLKQAFDARVQGIEIEEKFVTNSKRLSGTQVRGYISDLKEEELKMSQSEDKEASPYKKSRNQYINSLETLKGCFPEGVIQKGHFEDIMNILGVKLLSKEQLKESLIKELGDTPPLPFKKDRERLYNGTRGKIFEYSFKTSKGNTYEVAICSDGFHNYKNQLVWEVSFGYIGTDKSALDKTNKFEIKEILPTVIAIVKDFIEEQKPECIEWYGSRKDGESSGGETSRDKLYKYYLDKELKNYPGYEASKRGRYTVLSKKESLNEEQKSEKDDIENFINFCCNLLEIKEIPSIRFLSEPITDGDQPSFGCFDPTSGEIKISMRGSKGNQRHIIDIFRTLAHELVHQAQRNVGTELNGKTGSEVENEANSGAGAIMRKYGQLHPELF